MFRTMPQSPLLEAVRDRFDEFCHLCSLHGLIYLRRDIQLPTHDRVFWSLVFMSSLVVSCLAIYHVWTDWFKNQVDIVYDSSVRPIWDLPFPSVTICSLITVKKSVVDLEKTVDEKLLYFSSLICQSQTLFKNKNLSVSENEMKDFYDFITQATPSCEQMIRRCLFRNIEFSCCETFFPVITDLGICYTANTLPSRVLFTNQTEETFLFTDNYPKEAIFWSPEQGYPKPDQRGRLGYNVFPRWATSSGYEEGLSIEVEQNMSEWQDLCSGSYSGFKLLVNSPEEAPITSRAALRLPMKRDFLVELTPFVLRTAPELSTIAASERGCLFQAERNLDYFGIYSQDNCLLECLQEVALRKCGCVPFFMPRNSTCPVCIKASDRDCFREAEDELVAQSIAESTHYVGDELMVPWCNCYPSCNELTYNFVTNHGLFYKSSTTQNSFFSGDNYAKISIYFKGRHFLGAHRQIHTTFYDFFGTCGGLLGLMLGFSCISGVEILYHLIIRPISCLLINKRKEKRFLTPMFMTTASYLRNKHSLQATFDH